MVDRFSKICVWTWTSRTVCKFETIANCLLFLNSRLIGLGYNLSWRICELTNKTGLFWRIYTGGECRGVVQLDWIISGYNNKLMWHNLLFKDACPFCFHMSRLQWEVCFCWMMTCDMSIFVSHKFKFLWNIVFKGLSTPNKSDHFLILRHFHLVCCPWSMSKHRKLINNVCGN